MQIFKVVVLFVLLALSLSLCGCSWFYRETNPNVEIIVPANEEVGTWLFSPGGDKTICYSSAGPETTTFLLDLQTNEKRNLDFCRTAIWLDGVNILCRVESASPFVLVAEDFTQIPLKKIEPAPETLNKLLSQAAFIYRYKGDYDFVEADKRVLYLLNANYKENLNENYQVIVEENVDEVLQGYNYLVIPRQRTTSEGRENSPNGNYYYNNYYRALFIYDAITNAELVKYDYSRQGSIETGGWAADSSGVYFQPLYGGGFTPTEPGAIMKLKVPK